MSQLLRNTVSIKEIVEQYLLEKGDTIHSYPKVLNAMIRSLKELNWDVSGSPVYVVCDTDSNNQIDIPTDCVRMIDVGVINPNNGQFVSIEGNSSYAPRRTYNDCGTPQNQDNGLRLRYPESNFKNFGNDTALDTNRHGENVGRQYGLGGHSAIAQYSYDDLNQKINISSDASVTRFMLIYLSNLSTTNGDIMVNEFMVEPLLAGTEWILNRRLRSVPRGEKQILQHNFEIQKHNLSLRMSSLTKEQLMSLGWSGVKTSKL